jgi:putative inorganic carbon (HCO3(-)) transporter
MINFEGLDRTYADESKTAARNDIGGKGIDMDRDRIIQYIDHLILFCLCVLVFFLPIAHTETIRAISMGIPAGLWIIKSILSRRFLFTSTPVSLPILLFTLVAGMSVLTAVDPRYSLQEFIGDWLTGLFLFYLTLNNVKPEQMKYFLGTLLLGNLAMVTYGLYDYLRAGGQIFDYQIRAKSLHSGFGTFSTYLVTAIPYLLTAFILVERPLHRWLLFFLLALNYLSLYLTHSRGAWIPAALLLLLAGWKFSSRRVFLPILLTAGICFLVLSPPTVFWHTTPVHGPGVPAGKIETANVRWEAVKFSVEQIVDHPFRMLGFGRRSFVKEFKDFYLKYEGSLIWHAHNTFLNLALQTGIQGFALFCLLLYGLIKHFYAGIKQEEPVHLLFFGQATLWMIIAFFIRNLSDDFFVDDSALLFWFLVGAGMAIDKRSKVNVAEGTTSK